MGFLYEKKLSTGEVSLLWGAGLVSAAFLPGKVCREGTLVEDQFDCRDVVALRPA